MESVTLTFCNKCYNLKNCREKNTFSPRKGVFRHLINKFLIISSNLTYKTPIFKIKSMDYSILLKAPLFKDHSEEQIRTILSGIPSRFKKYRAGSLIAQSGDPVKSLMIVVSGQVKGEMVDFSGKVIKIEDVHPSGALAAAFMFGSRNSFPVNVVAVSDTELLCIDKPDFLKLLLKNKSILVNFLDMISNRSQFLSEKIKFLNFKTIKGKLAQYILQKAGENKIEIHLDMTQNDLAEFFGVARPSIARAIGELEEDGFIQTKGKSITILNKKGLAGLRFK